VRGRGIVVDGGYLFVGVDSSDLEEMRGLIASAFLWGLVATVVLAVAGGTVMSLSLLRHVEEISEASREIMAGDLGRRIPVRGSNDELDHLSTSLNAMFARIQDLMDGLRQVTSDIAHDLRTPLTRLRQRLELARHRPSSIDDLNEAIDRSIDDLKGILETFTALLSIAQIEANKSTERFRRIAVDRLLIDMAETYQSVVEENGQRLEHEVALPLRINGDRDLLQQLVSNLLDNAIRHCPAGSTIRIMGARANDDVRIAVADNGPGIPVHLRERVFQRFFRLERSRTTEGTGLGLSLVGAIATHHGATIALSDNNPGLVVTLTFPVSP
jgi:signal transduction histidine kinase